MHRPKVWRGLVVHLYFLFYLRAFYPFKVNNVIVRAWLPTLCGIKICGILKIYTLNHKKTHLSFAWILIFFVGLILIQINCGISKESRETRKLKYEISELIIHSDRIIDGDIVKIDLVLKNTGKIPIEIERIKTNCGCFISIWEKKEIPVNTQAVINFKYNSKNKSLGFDEQNKGHKRPNYIKLWINGNEEIIDFDLIIFKK